MLNLDLKRNQIIQYFLVELGYILGLSNDNSWHDKAYIYLGGQKHLLFWEDNYVRLREKWRLRRLMIVHSKRIAHKPPLSDFTEIFLSSFSRLFLTKFPIVFLKNFLPSICSIICPYYSTSLYPYSLTHKHTHTHSLSSLFLLLLRPISSLAHFVRLLKVLSFLVFIFLSQHDNQDLFLWLFAFCFVCSTRCHCLLIGRNLPPSDLLLLFSSDSWYFNKLHLKMRFLLKTSEIFNLFHSVNYW